MARPFPCVIIAASLASFAPALVAQPNGSLDTWVDACQATDPDLQALLANEALIVDRSFFTDNHDGTFALSHEPFLMATDIAGLPAFPMCTHARFYGETRVLVPGLFRSAVQVGPDLVLTALHSPATGGVADLRVVFGVHSRLVGGSCVAPDFSHVPAGDIYTVSVVADGLGAPNGVDYLLLRLDRETANAYPRVRRSGRGYPGDAATVIGHPERLSAKVDTAGVAGEVQLFDGRERLDVANVHLLSGNSGSMLYNRTQRILEAVASTGPGADIVPYPGTDPACYVIAHRDGWDSMNVSLRYFAQNIPSYELLVNSLDWVVLKARVGDPIAHQSMRRLSGPPGGVPVQYEIVPPPPSPAGQPTLTISVGGPLQGTLLPGQVLAVQQSAAAPAGVPCNVYERTYLVRDLTHGFEDVARHVFEIGKRGFSVSCGRLQIEDLADPFEDRVPCTVTNTQPSGFKLKVSSDQPWVSLNGEAGPLYETFDPTDVKQIQIGVLDTSHNLPHPEIHHAQITFEVAPDSSGCPVSPPVTGPFDFKYGTEAFVWRLGATIPDSSPTGVSVTQPVDEDACLGDVNLTIHTEGVDMSQLLFRLKSPGGTERVVWDHGDPANPFEIRLDEGVLNDFEGLGTSGTWTLTAVDTVQSPQPGTLKDWSLEFTACPFP